MLTLSTLITTAGQLHPACPCPALGSSPARALSLWSGHPPRGHFSFCYWEKSHQLKSSSFSLARKCMVCVFSVFSPPLRDGHLVSGWRPLSDPSRCGDGLLSLLSVPLSACLGALQTGMQGKEAQAGESGRPELRRQRSEFRAREGSRSAVSDASQPHGVQPTRPLRPQAFPQSA